MGVLTSIVFWALIGLGFGVVDGTVPCADCEFFSCDIVFPMEGQPVFAAPVYSACSQALYSYAPKIYPFHVFQISGQQRVIGILKVLKPGMLDGLIVEITNFGIEIECKPLYSFEAFAVFVGVPPTWAIAPLRALPCPRIWFFEVEISPAGNLTEYNLALKNFSAEILLLRKVGIIMDVYKVFGVVPVQFQIYGCGTPTFYDQLSLSISSLADDYGVLAIGRALALTKIHPIIAGRGSCIMGKPTHMLYQHYGKKK